MTHSHFSFIQKHDTKHIIEKIVFTKFYVNSKKIRLGESKERVDIQITEYKKIYQNTPGHWDTKDPTQNQWKKISLSIEVKFCIYLDSFQHADQKLQGTQIPTTHSF